MAAAVAIVSAPSGFGAADEALVPKDLEATREAVKALQAKQWANVKRLADRIADPLAVKTVQWLLFTDPDYEGSFAEVSRFIVENPGWPSQNALHQKAEEGMGDSLPPAAVLAWFKERPPRSTAGGVRLGAALVASGQVEPGRTLIREAWIGGSFGVREEQAFYRRYRGVLSREDHARRLDRLLWEGREDAARRMLFKVDPARRLLGEARLVLRRVGGGADRMVGRVPPELQNDPGLVYERVRWRRIKGRDRDARELLMQAGERTVYPEKWWSERAALARGALQKGYVSDAYAIVRRHGLKEGPEFADAAWMAGWIALRFLDEPKEALEHFTAMFRGVGTPVSRARAAYWAGRAAEAAGDGEAARRWYADAARHPAVFYGQLAALREKAGLDGFKFADSRVDADERRAFAGHPLARAIRILAAVGQEDRLRPFFLALLEASRAPGWPALTAGLARAVERPDLAIAVAKRSSRAGIDLLDAGYPSLDLPAVGNGRNGAPEVPLVLAVVRQESAFDPKAVSPAGARGLMQLIPRTANAVGRSLDEHQAAHRLLSDPSLNLRLGQAYLQEMLQEFGGSYVLALAAYNAGPARAKEWVRQNGDPRHADVDVVDWIEMIPFEETRNYVQRVLEGLQVYRLRSGGGLALDKDLKR